MSAKMAPMKRLVLVLICLCVYTSPVWAQPPTSYTLVISTGTTVVSTTTITAVNFLCNQTPPTGTTTVNPTRVVFNDPTNAGQACIFTDNGTTGPLSSLPFGAAVYTATLAATNTVGTSGPSLPSPSFTHPGAVPGVLTGVSVIR